MSKAGSKGNLNLAQDDPFSKKDRMEFETKFNLTALITTENPLEKANATDCHCLYATGVSYAVGFFVWPLLLCCLGFLCDGVRGGSCASCVQGACYGGETGGCFSLLQSCGAGGKMVGYLLCCAIIGAVIAVSVYFSCGGICDLINRWFLVLKEAEFSTPECGVCASICSFET